MKVCEICEKVESCVEVKHYENGEFRELSLCAACAQEHGLQLPTNLANLLLETTLKEAAESVPLALSEDTEVLRRCPVCRMRLSDFRRTGRLGCGGCYEAWGDVIEPMLLGMHRSLSYEGAFPVSDPDTTGRLQQALIEAVAQENFEEAARLRDRLREAQMLVETRQGEFLFDEVDEATG